MEKLTKEQVNEVIEFANALYSPNQVGVYSPFLSNSLMQNLNNDPIVPNMPKIKRALADYLSSGQDIQAYMDFMRFFDMLFSRTIQAYVNSLSFDLSYVPTNAFTESDYNSKEYADDKKRVEDFLLKFDYKGEFRKVVQQLMLRETYFVSFRKTKWRNQGMKYALQILPQNYCLLDGYWEKGLLFSFDMNYFLQAGTDLALYDPAMTEAYLRVFGENAGQINYRPSVELKDRNGTYANYTQLSPTNGFWAFKFDMSNFNNTPFLAPLLKSSITNDEVAQLQYNKDMIEAFAILAGEIRLFDNAKSGTQQNQFAISGEQIGKFMKLAKDGLSSLVKLAALPTENLKWFEYEDKNPNMYSTQLKTSAATGIGASRIIYASDRMSNSEVEAALNEIYQTMKPLYSQFNNFLDYYVNQITKKYRFKFMFDGSTYAFERKNRFEALTKLADKGVVMPPSMFASAMGVNPVVFEKMLADSKYSGWIGEYSQLMLNTNTTSQSSGGRPRQETVTDSGEYSREMLEEEELDE